MLRTAARDLGTMQNCARQVVELVARDEALHHR
jgi:hypothetical protein